MIIEVKVNPRNSKSELVGVGERKYKAYVKSAPVDGRANMELIELISKEFGCTKSDVYIKRGDTSKVKLIEIRGVDQKLF